jgi:hypothetical protein
MAFKLVHGTTIYPGEGSFERKQTYSVTKEKQIDLYKYGCKINNLTLQLYHVKNFSGSMQNKIVHTLFVDVPTHLRLKTLFQLYG